MVEITREQLVERFKSLDTNGDGHLGSKERADAIVDKLAKKECTQPKDYAETYKYAHGTKAEPTKQELAKFLDGMANPDLAATGGLLVTGMTEFQLRTDESIKNIFPKGVEHSTKEDFERTGEALSAKIAGCAKKAAAELRR